MVRGQAHDNAGCFTKGLVVARVTVICKQCKKEYQVLPHKVKRREYCSRQCANNAKIGKIGARRIPRKLEDNAIALYQTNEPIPNILRQCGIGQTTLFRIIKRNGIHKRKPYLHAIECFQCKKLFTPKTSRSKYCSRLCQHKWMKGKRLTTGRTYFKKGMEPWNKGIEWIEMKGEKHPCWKGKINTDCPSCGKRLQVHPYRIDGVAQVYCSAKCAISDKWKDTGYRKHMVTAHLGQEAWSKGKTLEECHGKDKAEILLKKNREHMLKMYESGKFPKQTGTAPERAIKQEFINRGYVEGKDFIHQFKFHDKFMCDFVFPAQKVIVECDGDFWHANPAKYAGKELKPAQKRTLKQDKSKYAYIQKVDNGSWIAMRFWESDIKKDVKACVDRIETKLRNRSPPKL